MDEIVAIIQGLFQHTTAPSLYQYITAYPELLSDARVDPCLVNILDDLQQKEMDLVTQEVSRTIASHIRTLRLCKLIGVDRVFQQEIAEKLSLIGYFLDLKTWEQSQEFLENHPELVQEQVEWLVDCLAQVQLDRESSARVQEHRELLKRCREVGIDRAFQEKIKALDLAESEALYPINIIAITEGQRQNHSMFQVYGVRLPGFVNHLAKFLRLKYTLFPWDLLYVEWLKKIYAITSTEKNILFPEEDIIFFIQSLQVSWNSQKNFLVIYKFLEKNLDHLNDTLRQFLYSFNKDSLGGLDTETLANFAVTALDLFELIENYPHGNEEINREIAIAGYEIVANPFIREAALEEWVRAQVYLATAYRDRKRGERSENIEKTIVACRNGLQACNERSLPKRRIKLESELKKALSKRNYGKESSPEEIIFAYSPIWYAYSNRENNPKHLDNIIEEILAETSSISDNARSKLNVLVRPLLVLSSAYSNSVQGNRSEYLERSISCSQDILDIVDCQTNPIEWAAAQHTLGYAYTERVKEKHAQNVEKAIRCHLAALDKCTREVSALEWARGQSDLGIAYKERVLGERAENLEAAIQCYSSALEVYSRELYPFEWAKTQYNLGVARVDRIRGNNAENLADAIQCFSSALEVFTIEDYSQKWASTMQALGNTYLNLSPSVSMIEEAIQCFSSALKVYSSEFSPFEWARTQFNLSNAYSLLSMQKNRAENLETAIRLCLLSLEVRLRKTDSNRWAMSQSHLGLLYSRRVNGERTKNLEFAIEYFLRALEVYSYEAYPLKYAKNQYFLGIAYRQANRIENAYTVFKKAIDCIESIREEIIFGTGMEADKQKLAEEWNDLYQNMIKVCLELEKPVEAIEYVERSKTRNLVELILSKDIDTIFTPDVVSKLEEFQDEIASGQYELQNATAEDPTALAQHLQQLRQQRNELQDRYLPIGSGFQFDQFRLALSQRTAIVEFYITSDKLLVFIITEQTQQPIVFSSDLIDPNKLAKCVNSYLKAYSNKKSHWQRRLTTRLHLLAKILHVDKIVEQIPTECDRLILIPHRYLHLVPLHALPVNSEAGTSKPQILMDRFPKGVRYAPSCQLLQLAKTRKRSNFTHLFAIQNPTNDLTYADLEVAAIQSYFDSTSILEKDAATKTALDGTPFNTFHCVHFSCHGYFNSNPSQANKSALILADAELDSSLIEFDSERHFQLTAEKLLDLDKCLTLDAIFSLKFQLDRCRLVVLSACETGLIDFRNTSDEYIGLVSGFLFAGSPSVVSSLWAVDQVSTAFLFIKFYENLKSYLELKEGDVAMALQDAQNWLRNLTSEEGEKLLDKIQLQIESLFPGKPRKTRAFKIGALKRIKESGIYPFADPYYWTAFIATGF